MMIIVFDDITSRSSLKVNLVYIIHMRVIRFLFLCFTIAFANVGYAHDYEAHCPMEQAAHMDGMDHSIAGADCCNDAETAAKTGNPCKTYKNCSVSTLVIFSSSPSLKHFSIKVGSTLTGIPSLPASIPFSVWRPPTIS